jgi:hypothetical protein
MVLLGWIGGVTGCASEGEEPACRPGFVRAADGHCYPPPPDPQPPTANDVLEQSGPCVARKDGEEIDIVDACIEGACAGDLFPEVRVALGLAGGEIPAEPECEVEGSEWSCVWPQDVEARFPVNPNDQGLPLDTARATIVRARWTYEGASPEGLGIGVSPRCWIDALGLPTVALFTDIAGTLIPTDLVWNDHGIEIEDEEGRNNSGRSDGLIDEITLFTPP